MEGGGNEPTAARGAGSIGVIGLEAYHTNLQVAGMLPGTPHHVLNPVAQSTNSGTAKACCCTCDVVYSPDCHYYRSYKTASRERHTVARHHQA